MSRPISDAWFHRIKSATRDLVRNCGGLERCAELTSLGKSTIGRYQSAADPDIITLPAVVALEADCGIPFVTSVMAELNGRRLSDPEAAAGATVSCVIKGHADVMQRSADLAGAMADAMSDLVVTPAEAEIADRRLSELMTSASDLRQKLAALKAGEPSPGSAPVRLVPRGA